MPEKTAVDVLLVSLGTTAGWRRSDAEVERSLGVLGVSVARCTSDYRIVRHLRRTMPLTDLAEAAAMRWALTKALRRHRPRAIVYSSTQATMLQPRSRLEGATGIRFDSLARENRPGRQNALQHRLERRSLAKATVLLPAGLRAARRVPADVARSAAVVPLPLPVEPVGEAAVERAPIALSYAGNPEKKGLDVIARAWQTAEPPRVRLVVAGIEAARGRAFLRRHGIEEPAGVEWAGMLDTARYRELSGRAELFVAASRYEEYGLAQLEALADGALLVTVPSAGSYEALDMARELAPRLVAQDISPQGLGKAALAALSLTDEERRSYRARPRALLAPYSRAELERRLERDVLPLLLG